MAKRIQLTATVPETLAGRRLDQALALMFEEHSRSRLQTWIKGGQVRLNHHTAHQRTRVQGGEYIEVDAEYETRESWSAEEIPLRIVHEDEALIILDKPAGLVVHPGAGNRGQTLLNALLHHDPGLELVPRAGIVQRLDKDTSGIMVVAKTPEVHTYLISEMQARAIKRLYQAIVTGVMTAGGTIDRPIGRHPRKRTHMAVISNGKPAVTHYRIIKRYRNHTHIKVELETGRTHQIRVHLASINYPIVGDPIYAGRPKIPKKASQELINALRSFPRQALHAFSLSLVHPLSKQRQTFEVPLAEDIVILLALLETHDSS